MVLYFDTQDAVDELSYRHDTPRHGQGTVSDPVSIYFCGEWIMDNGEW